MGKRVFLGSLIHPVKKYCLPSWIENLQKLNDIDQVLLANTSTDERFRRETASYPYQVVSVPEENMFRGISRGRQELFRRFLQTNATHFFSLECDVFPEPEVPFELLKYEEQIVSVPYVLGYMYEPVRRLKTDYLISITDQNKVHYTMQEFLQKANNREIVEVNEAGMGCLMMNRSVVERYLPKTLVSDKRCDDQAFYSFCREQGIDRFAIPGLIPRIAHYPHFHMNYGVYVQHLERKARAK